jgi:hypothetical protein
VSKEGTPDTDREDSETGDELEIEPQPKKQQKQKKVEPRATSRRARADKREKVILQKMGDDVSGVAEENKDVGNEKLEFADLIAFDPPSGPSQRFFQLFILVYKNAYVVSDNHVVGTVFDHPPSTLAVEPATGNDHDVVLSDSASACLPLPSTVLAPPVDVSRGDTALSEYFFFVSCNVCR